MSVAAHRPRLAHSISRWRWRFKLVLDPLFARGKRCTHPVLANADRGGCALVRVGFISNPGIAFWCNRLADVVFLCRMRRHSRYELAPPACFPGSAHPV